VNGIILTASPTDYTVTKGPHYTVMDVQLAVEPEVQSPQHVLLLLLKQDTSRYSIFTDKRLLCYNCGLYSRLLRKFKVRRQKVPRQHSIPDYYCVIFLVNWR
jgi:hypothetical protein